MTGIVLGPRRREAPSLDEYQRYSAARQSVGSPAVNICNCIGPQPGETKCPCSLRAELEQGLAMVRDGVVINGTEYELVPKRKEG